MQKKLFHHSRFQFISHFNDRYSYLDGIKMALEGGCRWIQLRMKDATDDEVRPIAIEVQKWCKEADATFIIDDRVQLVKELHADGVHLGKNDMPIQEARQILGDGFIIGGTANTLEDVISHAKAGADYIGCGPFRYTTTKQRLSPILGSSPDCSNRRHHHPRHPRHHEDWRNGHRPQRNHPQRRESRGRNRTDSQSDRRRSCTRINKKFKTKNKYKQQWKS